jgi:hypothetical protein
MNVLEKVQFNEKTSPLKKFQFNEKIYFSKLEGIFGNVSIFFPKGIHLPTSVLRKF